MENQQPTATEVGVAPEQAQPARIQEQEPIPPETQAAIQDLAQQEKKVETSGEVEQALSSFINGPNQTEVAAPPIPGQGLFQDSGYRGPEPTEPITPMVFDVADKAIEVVAEGMPTVKVESK